jgi:ADP-glucose pyrophosphorylase
VVLADLTTSVQNDLNGSVGIPPVDIGTDVALESSVVGLKVKIYDGTKIEHSILSDAILCDGAAFEMMNHPESILNDKAALEAEANEFDIGDNSSHKL